MADNSTSYPMYSGDTELPWANIDYGRNACRQIYTFLSYIELIY